jgi:hypothetical protein
MRRGGRTLARATTPLVLTLFLASQACVVYEPVPVHAPAPGPSTYDRAWESALRAAQDSGIALTSVDRSAGLIAGSRAGIDVRISVLRQADGTTRVETNLGGDLARDPTLSDRFQASYERYMGR